MDKIFREAFEKKPILYMLALLLVSSLMAGGARTAGVLHLAYTDINSPGGEVIAGLQLVDVRAFGAKGDGVTDDRGAIQSAIDNAPSSGATIYFPTGVYLLKSFHPSNLNSGILRMRSNITFAGTGIGSEIRLHAGWYAGKGFNIFSNYDSQDPNRFGAYRNIGFRDLLIDAGGAGNTYAGTSDPRVVIQFGDTSNAWVERVTFTGINVTNVIGVGRGRRSSSGFRVVGCTFIDPTSGDPKNPDHSTIYSSVTDTVISGNTFRNSTNRGKANATAAELHASRSTFMGNIVESYRQALYLASQEYALVEDVVVDNNVAHDMNAYFANFWGDSDSNVVRRVKFLRNKAEFNPSRAEVDGTAQFIGTTAKGHFSEVTIEGNVASTTPGIWKNKRAIATFTSIADWTVISNRFSGWDGGGVHVIHVHRGKTATRVKISRNEFIECANAGTHKIPIYLNLEKATDIMVDDNRFQSSTATQYIVYLAAESSAAGYYVSGNEPAGYTPITQDVYVGGPAPPGLPRGVTPGSVSGKWSIRGIRIDVPRLLAGKTVKLSARISASEYVSGKAIATPLPRAGLDAYELSEPRFMDQNTLTMTLRNRTDGTLEPTSMAVDLRVFYP